MSELLQEEHRQDLHDADENLIGKWIEKNTARLNVLMPLSVGPHVLSLIEGFLHCRLKPMFEGRRLESRKVAT